MTASVIPSEGSTAAAREGGRPPLCARYLWPYGDSYIGKMRRAGDQHESSGVRMVHITACKRIMIIKR